MWQRKLFVFFIGVTVASAGRAPNADYIEELVQNHSFGPRFSDNLLEDARLDVPELVRKYRYPLEVHEVTTSDGYILRMHRIPHGRDQNNVPGVKKPVVFLMHGLLSSSADWIVMGPGNAFGYILAEYGFDVWMGNARGNYYSRRHVRLNPNSIFSNAFWEFSWDEIGNLDLPAMIDYALNHTGQKKLHYVGHSQGTTAFFVMGSLRPEFNNKILSMHAFGPVAYMAHNKNPLLTAISPFANRIEDLASLMGIGEFMPNNLIMTWAGQAMCRDEVVTQAICSNILFLIGGWNEAQHNAPELILKYKYPLEVHEVTTPDGYILQMHRIPHGRDQNNVPGLKRPIVFLMHGLLCSSADWIISGPGSAFGYVLAEEGFDVWMGNGRGNYYSRNHFNLNPDNTDFWDFSWDEIGNIDLPTMIDHTLAITGNEKIHYIGHSQGTTAFFVMCSLQPEYNDKIISMHAFSPVAFMAYNESPVLNAIAPFANSIKILASLIGIGEIMPNTLLLTWAGQIFCKDRAVTQEICSNILFSIGGWNDAHLNTTMMPVIFGHTPAGSSVKQFAHYGQSIATKEFRRYDHGFVKNIRLYGRRSPPKYNLSNIVVPIFFYYSDNDPLSQSKDVYRLYEELGSESKVLLPLPSFGHLDYLWGINVKPLLYDTVIQLMEVAED